MSHTPPQTFDAPVGEERAPGAPPADDALPGMQLGDYVVEKAVAWGGMGIVYRAVHPLIGRKVAVKVLRPNFASDPEQMSRFLKEAQAISAINHRGIIDIIGFGKLPLPDGRQYMVMEYLEGETLEAVMNREGAMTPVRALTLIDEVLDALSAAHKVGVVHRDLKPSNVYITEQSNGSRYVKLVDFGLARRASIEDLNRHSGKASLMAGTPEYLSPEQARGLSATPRTDLYCMGVMLFEMVTGRLPFIAESVIELLGMHLNQVAPRASVFVGALPQPLDDLIAQLLLKPPEQRPTSADVCRQTVTRMLRQLKDDETRIGVRPGAPLQPMPRGMAAPVAEDETTRRLQKKGMERAGFSDQTAIVDDPEAIRRLRAASETTRMPAVDSASAVTPAPRPPSTEPELDNPRRSKATWALLAAGAVLVGGAAVLLGWPSADSVIEVPLPPATAIAEPVEVAQVPGVEAPPVAVTPVGAQPQANPDEPAPLTAQLKPRPPRPAKSEVRPTPAEERPEICESTEWKKLLDQQFGPLEQTYLKNAGTASPEVLQALEAWRGKAKLAHSIDDCASVARGLRTWKNKNVR